MSHTILLVINTAITRLLLLSLVNVAMHNFPIVAIAILNDDIVYAVNLILDTKSEMECEYRKGVKYLKLYFRKFG